MSLCAGTKLGPYELLAPIGAGGMGEVWKARDTRLNRIVAVKRLKGPHTARFEQEARAIAALNHPHICQIFDIGPDYLVLEYIDGQPLLSQANPGPLEVEEAVRLARQIAEALDAAHRKGVVHRDLKPANILVTAEGSVKLLDFGLAKQAALSGETATDETGTIEGTVMGTVAYMAPEQAAGKPLDARSDVFSFGAVLYELLSGRQAFRGENAISTMAAILHTEPRPLDAPAALQQILKRCLAKPPAERYQTMAELLESLREAFRKAVQTEMPAQQQPSIAVLPFANIGADNENEYFSDGLAEEIINFLAQIPGLKVTARTSAFAFRGKEQDIRKIASALGVASILEGSVRRFGNRIRVTAQLINAADGYHLWSQRYDREMADLFDLQDEIAQAIASALQVKLSGAPAPFEQYKPNLPAYEALLKARHYLGSFRPDLLPRIKEYFEQAIALDPKFALAHCEYGGYFGAMALVGTLPANHALPMMRSLAQTALELDPSLPEGHAMLGYVAACLDYDWKEGERRFRLAMARDPIPVFVRLYYVMGYLLPTGRAAASRSAVGSRSGRRSAEPYAASLPGARSRRSGSRRGSSRRISPGSGLQSGRAGRARCAGRLPCVARRVGRGIGTLRKGVRPGACSASDRIARRAAAAHRRNTPGRRNDREARSRCRRRSPRSGDLPLGAAGIRRGGGLAREGHRPARSLRRHLSAGLVRKGTAFHSALGGLDAEDQFAGIVIVVSTEAEPGESVGSSEARVQHTADRQDPTSSPYSVLRIGSRICD